MLTRRFNLATLICGLMTLAFVGLGTPSQRPDPPRLIESSIAIVTDTLTQGKTSFVNITIENISGREIDLKSICSFELLRTDGEAIATESSVWADSFWSPVDVLTGTPLKLDAEPEMLKKGILQGRVPEVRLRFTKNETKTFKVDLTKLHWNTTKGNVWPHKDLFDVVPKGRYWLVFSTASDGDHESNKVEVTVE